MRSVEPLVLTEEDRAELERRVRAQTTAHRDRLRAHVVLLAADGVPGRQIASRVGLSPQSVSKWRIRFLAHGLEGLDDAERSGRPLVYGPTDRLVLMAKVTSAHPEFSSQWSQSELAEAMAACGIEISASQIGRILAADDVKPHRVDGWLTRRDTPEFWERAADVCGLSRQRPVRRSENPIAIRTTGAFGAVVRCSEAERGTLARRRTRRRSGSRTSAPSGRKRQSFRQSVPARGSCRNSTT